MPDALRPYAIRFGERFSPLKPTPMDHCAALEVREEHTDKAIVTPFGTLHKPAVFLDRDGVINENRDDYVKSWEEVQFLPGVFEALRKLATIPFLIVIVTNQSAINRGIVPQERVEEINARLVKVIRGHGGRIDGVFYCPHRPDEDCYCRKPRPGLLLKAARVMHIDLRRSYLIGDAVSDVEAALAAGVKPLFVLTGRGSSQLPLLQAKGYNNCPVFTDLPEAVDWILQNTVSEARARTDIGGAV